MKIDDHAIDTLVSELLAQKAGASPPPPPRPPLNPGDGSGRFNPMEPRIARLEAHMEHVQGQLAKLADLPKGLAVLEERVSHLPTKSWMVTGLASALAVIAALITFGEKLQALVR